MKRLAKKDYVYSLQACQIALLVQAQQIRMIQKRICLLEEKLNVFLNGVDPEYEAEH